MSVWRAILLNMALSSLAHGASAATLQIDAQSCAALLQEGTIEKFVLDHGARRTLGTPEGLAVGTFIPGDLKTGKLIDVRGSNFPLLTHELIRYLKYDQDAQKNENLANIIESSLRLAHGMPAAFSISSFVMPNGKRTIRLSLDMSMREADQSPVIRLPDLEIRNGESVKRVDIDIKPDQLTLLTGTTQAIHVGGHWLVGEPASHSLGLEIEGNDDHLLIDSFGSPSERFIGPESKPALRELLTITEKLARAVFPRAVSIGFREDTDIKAVSEGHGWHLPN